MNLRFLGLFDTVASVGLADSSPVGRGLLHWAHNTPAIEVVEKATGSALGIVTIH